MPESKEFQLPKLHYVVENTAEDVIEYPADGDLFSTYKDFDRKVFSTIDEAIKEYKKRIDIYNHESIEEALNYLAENGYHDEYDRVRKADGMNITISCIYDSDDLKMIVKNHNASLMNFLGEYDKFHDKMEVSFETKTHDILIMSHDWISADLNKYGSKDKRIMDAVKKVQDEILNFDFKEVQNEVVNDDIFDNTIKVSFCASDVRIGANVGDDTFSHCAFIDINDDTEERGCGSIFMPINNLSYDKEMSEKKGEAWLYFTAKADELFSSYYFEHGTMNSRAVTAKELNELFKNPIYEKDVTNLTEDDFKIVYNEKFENKRFFNPQNKHEEVYIKIPYLDPKDDRRLETLLIDTALIHDNGGWENYIVCLPDEKFHLERSEFTEEHGFETVEERDVTSKELKERFMAYQNRENRRIENNKKAYRGNKTHSSKDDISL